MQIKGVRQHTDIFFKTSQLTKTWGQTHFFPFATMSSTLLMTNPNIQVLKVALQILGQKFYKNTKISSLYSQSLLIFIHKTSVVERHYITREIRDLLWPKSTPTGNTVYFYMSSSLIYILKIHIRSFKHNDQ